jgi:PEP-CTERM motif
MPHGRGYKKDRSGTRAENFQEASMHLKGSLAMSLSALLFCAVPAVTTAHADTFAWTNWTTGTSGNPGSASGTLAGGITVTYSGQTSGLTTEPSWTPTTTFSGGPIGNAPPSTASIALEGTAAGAVPIMETITFSSPVVDPVFAIWSLGQTGDTASFDFVSKSQQIPTLISGGPSNEFGGSSITVNGQIVSGTEGNGVIEFDGTFTSISFTTPNFENFYAFTVGEDENLTTPAVPEPATLSLFGLGLAALPIGRKLLSRRRS